MRVCASRLVVFTTKGCFLRKTKKVKFKRGAESHASHFVFPIFNQNVYATFTLPPKPRCLPLHRICYLVLTQYQNVQFACKFAVMPLCLPTQPVTPRSMVMGLLPGFTCQPNSIIPLLPFTLGLGASPLTL